MKHSPEKSDTPKHRGISARNLCKYRYGLLYTDVVYNRLMGYGKTVYGMESFWLPNSICDDYVRWLFDIQMVKRFRDLKHVTPQFNETMACGIERDNKIGKLTSKDRKVRFNA